MDGIPNVIIEAGAYKVPAVTSDLPGLREAVQDGYNGYITKAGSEEELAQALQKFLDLTPGEKTEMGEHARQNVIDNFDISKNIQQWIDTFSRRGIEI